MQPAPVSVRVRPPLENRETFFIRIRERWPEASREYQLIEKSYVTAKEALRGIGREDGVRYFEHARGVALILIDSLKNEDAYAISLALLHDIIEENPEEWNVERVREEFGDDIAEGERFLTKPKDMWRLTDCGLSYHASFWHASRRVATVKLADRYHNLLTLGHCSLAKQLRKREETHTHYLPLAHYWEVLAHELQTLLETPPSLHLEGVP